MHEGSEKSTAAFLELGYYVGKNTAYLYGGMKNSRNEKVIKKSKKVLTRKSGCDNLIRLSLKREAKATS